MERISSYFPGSLVHSADQVIPDCGLAIAFHPLRCRRSLEPLVTGDGRPHTALIVVVTGTDVNTPHTEQEVEAMRLVVGRCARVVAFTHEMAQRAGALFGLQRDVAVIPQAIAPAVVTEADAAEAARIAGSLGGGQFFLLVAGLRPVKDPAFLAAAARGAGLTLAVAGPALDRATAELVAREFPPEWVLGPLERGTLFALMRDPRCVAVVNSSLEEGQCNVLMEAMLVGTPVIARANAGNRALLRDGADGMLFTTAQEFVACARRALAGEGRASAAARFVHELERERQQYLELVKEITEQDRLRLDRS
jgi:glycosyltransferase involved in cell wall biosynthesis